MAIDTEKLEAQLAEAEDTLQEFLMGKKVVKAGYDGGDTEFNRTSEAAIRRQIASLKRKLGDTSVPSMSQKVIF